MAVQAQYPSNLPFHDRGEPERKEMDMPGPPQLAGVSPAALYFSSGGASGNRRKRPREAMAPPPAKEEYVNLFTLQPQQSTSIAYMAHLQNQNRFSSSPSPAATALVSTGLRLAFDGQQQQQESKQMNASCYSSSPSLFASVSDELATQVKQHDEEIDRFIREQGEQLRRAFADRLRRHNRAILVKANQCAARRLREKAAEAEREARRGAELEDRLALLRGEAAAWQAKALSEQAIAVTLHAQLQQAAAAARASVEEIAGGDAGPAESSSSAYVDPRRTQGSSDRACLSCRLRPASVVLLPCRHLCLCGECFAGGDVDVAMACPVCLCVRTGSVEAILC
ncbi:BOI-related E3 ubiquitin-protein ligase 1-like [Phragmites australis]|uniref:BOI-related E3 ubiquitin-protein ligase 1-like n=1 Tax=Phragmites australis TaxID=29695 RepID=UPI002D77CDFA|nr:BOI-related E3 ubiquitin-protein ligase 1-like [Phragmites australis]